MSAVRPIVWKSVSKSKAPADRKVVNAFRRLAVQLMLYGDLMLSRIMISVVAAAAMLVTPIGSAARSCILVNAPSQTACQPRCCANMTCCITSSKNTAPSSQPLAKNASSHETNAICAPSVFAVLQHQSWENWSRCQIDGTSTALSPPRLPLLCTFLI